MNNPLALIKSILTPFSAANTQALDQREEPRLRVCTHTQNGYFFHLIDDFKNANDLHIHMQHYNAHPDPDDSNAIQSSLRFATQTEATQYLDQLIDISHTFTMQPYVDGYLDDDLIAGPIELRRMQQLVRAADIDLSPADQSLLYGNGLVKRGAFENAYLNQTVHILSARELISALMVFLEQLEECALWLRDIDATVKYYKKLPPIRAIARRSAIARTLGYKSYLERDYSNLKHVNENRALRPLATLYGDVYHYGYPFTYTTLFSKRIGTYIDMVWDQLGQSVGLTAAEQEWANGPLNEIGDLSLLQTIQLHRLVNHQILARNPNHDPKDHTSALNLPPDQRLTPDEFAKHFPRLAHLTRFVSQNSCYSTYYWPTPNERKGPIIPILDQHSSRYCAAFIHSGSYPPTDSKKGHP